MQRDHIGDFINRLMTAARAGRQQISIARTALLERVARAIADCGYITVTQKKDRAGKDELEIAILRNDAGNARIRGVERVSRLSRRVYRGVRSRGGPRTTKGHLIMSTSKGIFELSRSKREKVGGELLFRIW